MQLPILESCDGCGGACCSEMTAPGAYVTLLLHPEWQTHDDEDALRLQHMPAAARNEIERYVDRGQHQGFPFRVPCFWLLPDGRCQWYDWRPRECRDFELGNWSCHHWRSLRTEPEPPSVEASPDPP